MQCSEKRKEIIYMSWFLLNKKKCYYFYCECGKMHAITENDVSSDKWSQPPPPLLPQSQSIWIYLHSFVNHLYIDLKIVLLHYFSIQFPLLIILSHLFLFEQWKKWKIFTHCGEKLVEKKILLSSAIHANHLNLLTGNQ